MTNRTAVERRRDPIGRHLRMQARMLAEYRQILTIRHVERHATFLVMEGLRRKR